MPTNDPSSVHDPKPALETKTETEQQEIPVAQRAPANPSKLGRLRARLAAIAQGTQAKNKSKALDAQGLSESAAAPDEDTVTGQPSPFNRVAVPARRLGERMKAHPKAAFWVIALTTSSLTGILAFQWLTGLPPTPNCRKLFQATLSDSGQLYCADQAARRGDEASLSAALQLASSITEENPLFEQSKQLSDHWSEAILLLARQKVEAGDLKKGVALAQKVPKSSGVYGEAQATIQDWQANWQTGEAIFKKAKTAIQDQNWGLANEQIRNLIQIGSQYWQGQADKIVREMSVEQEAFYKIASAQDIAASGRPQDIAEAIQAVSQIDPKRLARKRVAEKIDEWSQQLVDAAKSAQAVGDYEAMVFAAQKVPPSAKVAAVAAAYLQWGRAEMVGKDANLWSALQAQAFMAQMDPKTPAYEESKAQRQKWQGHIQGWGQLALAQWIAGFDQVLGYKMAVDQAAMVTAEQPRRVEAQTLIAFWNKQIDSFPERQFIARAKQMAVDNTVASLQSAVLEAGKVLSTQSLWNTAQALIAEWGNAVQRVEDQPILDQAIALARKGDLNGAIQQASKIKSGRALYGDAQIRVGEWVAQIQAVEDRPILNEAEALANEGRLSEAIARASDIGSNRAMYGEAQGRIADWAARLREIRAASEPPPEEAPPPEPEAENPPEAEAPTPEAEAPPPEPDAPPPAESSEPPPGEPPAGLSPSVP